MTITTAVLSALTLGLVGGVAVPSALSAAKLAKDTVVERGKIDSAIELRIRMRKSSGGLSDTKSRINELGNVALHEGRELEFIQAVENAEKETGVLKVISLQTEQKKVLSPWEQEVPIGIHASGSYEQVLRFVNALERLPYAVIVSEITMENAQGPSEKFPDGIAETLINATVYWQSKEAPPYTRGETAGSEAAAAAAAAASNKAPAAPAPTTPAAPAP